MKSLKAVMIAATLTTAATAMAQATNPDTFDVTANVIGNCVITVGDIAFGDYDPVEANATADATASSTVSVSCTKGTTGVTVLLDGGGNAGTDGDGNRAMLGETDNTESLGYFLHLTSATGALWGDNTAALGNAVAFTGWTADSSAVTQTLFGVLPAGQDDVSVQSFRDTVTATVDF